MSALAIWRSSGGPCLAFPGTDRTRVAGAHLHRQEVNISRGVTDSTRCDLLARKPDNLQHA
jgi:hypothetical protein